MTFESEGLLIVATVYSFEFAQSYFPPTEIWDWFAQSWIRPRVLLYKPLCIIQFTQFWIRPQTKGRK